MSYTAEWSQSAGQALISPGAGVCSPAAAAHFDRQRQSTWNREDRFTGWADVPPTGQGEREMREAAEKLRGVTLAARIHIGLITHAGVCPNRAERAEPASAACKG